MVISFFPFLLRNKCYVRLDHPQTISLSTFHQNEYDEQKEDVRSTRANRKLPVRYQCTPRNRLSALYKLPCFKGQIRRVTY